MQQLLFALLWLVVFLLVFNLGQKKEVQISYSPEEPDNLIHPDAISDNNLNLG